MTIGATLAGNAMAQNVNTPESPVKFFIGGGLTLGGDKLATANYTNGDSSSLHAGGLLQLHAGVQFRASENVTISGAVGYHVDNATASNGSIKFDRIPVELLAHYSINEQWRLGGGARFVSSPKLSGSGAGSGIDASFGSTTGAVLEAEYMISPKAGATFRLVSEKYPVPGGGKDVDGSHAGVFLNYYF